MSKSTAVTTQTLRRLCLVSSLVAALAITPAHASDASAKPIADATTANRTVTSCGDDANTPGTLRYEVLHAANGGVIDLSALVCSTITLSSAIEITQDSLTLQGSAAQTPHVTIDAAGNGEVIRHSGHGVLRLIDVSMANGNIEMANLPTGGCIYSVGSVYLYGAYIAHCTVTGASSGNVTAGGGIFALGDLTMIHSEISDAHAISDGGSDSVGGAVFVGGDFELSYSTLSESSADGLQGTHGAGGGAFAVGNVDIYASTIARNRATFAGALMLSSGAPNTAWITDSTISSNEASGGTAAIRTSVPLTLASSTIAFNHSDAHIQGDAGVFVSDTVLTLTSSIIAGNSDPSGQSDLDGTAAASVVGSHSLVTSFGNVAIAAGTITSTSCPRLDRLADNGGPTLTHALLHTSPAIDFGAPASLPSDQRGLARAVGMDADIGAFERQANDTDDRVFVGGFDGLCDQ